MKPVIAVVNTTPELIAMLEDLLAQEGYPVVTANLTDFRSGKRDLIEFINTHDPSILIYDLPPPYAEQLKFLHLFRDLQVIQGRKFIFTTTNRKALEEVKGGSQLAAIEVIGKPFDLEQILEAVRKAEKDWKSKT